MLKVKVKIFTDSLNRKVEVSNKLCKIPKYIITNLSTVKIRVDI